MVCILYYVAASITGWIIKYTQYILYSLPVYIQYSYIDACEWKWLINHNFSTNGI